MEQKKPGLKIFLLTIISVLVVSALLAPWIKMLLIYGAGHFGFLKGLSEYELHRILSRVIMVNIFLSLIIFRKKLLANSGVFKVLKPQKGDGKWFLAGLLFGIFTLSLQVFFAVVFQGRTFFTYKLIFSKVVIKTIECLFSAVLIGVMEEFLFRGVLFKYLWRKRSFIIALLISSLVYSCAHFFRPKDITGVDELSPFAGFIVIFKMMSPFLSPDFMFESVGLFLVGACLAAGYYYSKSLYFPIAVHAGWVFVIKMDGMMITRTTVDKIWLWGSSNIVGGIATWLLLVMIFLTFKYGLTFLASRFNENQKREI